MPSVHLYIGFTIVGLFTLLWIWGFAARVMKRRNAGAAYWWLVTALQVLVGVQALIGIALLIFVGPTKPWLHYAYGLFPIIAFIAAHVYARRESLYPYFPFAVAGFICMGLTLRALMTGLGLA